MLWGGVLCCDIVCCVCEVMSNVMFIMFDVFYVDGCRRVQKYVKKVRTFLCGRGHSVPGTVSSCWRAIGTPHICEDPAI